MLTTKRRRRMTTIGLNIVNNLAVPFFNAAISFLVIRLNSDVLWGAFVSVMIVVQFGAHIASWGNKEYLLREFSRHPDQIALLWWSSLRARLMLAAILCLPLLFFGYTPQRFILAVLWGFGIVLLQSFEVLILYRKAFLFDTVVKAGTIFCMAVVLLIIGRSLTVDGLLALFAGAYAVQALIYSAHFLLKPHPPAPSPLRREGEQFLKSPLHAMGRGFRGGVGINWQFFRRALPFFLLGFSGLLASRIDLYAISYYLDERATGQYQVFINFMIYVQAVSNFIMLPYVKNIYRMQDSTITKISLRLFVLGIIIVIPATLAIHALLLSVYHIQFSAAFMFFGGLFVLPIFGYIPLIHRLYKRDQQMAVLWVNLAGAGVNLLLNMVLLPEIGITGAILSSAVVQWGMLAVYLVQSRGEHERLMPDLSPAD